MFKYENKVKDVFGLDETKGNIGIEIEIEAKNPYFWDSKNFNKVWKIENDGSLKNNGMEFVIKKPILHSEVNKTVDNFKIALDKKNIKISNSVRAGVHIHLNMQEKSVKDLMMFLACYYPLDTVLTKFCGEGRESNLFCLRLRDAEYTINILEKFLINKKIMSLCTDELRYSTLNFQSMFKFGTVEFRALGTDPSLDKIKTWCEIIKKLEDYSMNLNSAWGNLTKLSGFGAKNMLYDIFGEELTKKLEYDGMEKDMIEDSRLIQNFCHILG